MNYDIFDHMEEGEYGLQAGETEQEWMERIIQKAMETRPMQEKVFNDMLCPEFAGCSAEDDSIRLKFPIEMWQQNPNGVLHGGIIASMIDATCGILGRYCTKSSKIVTVQMNLDFMRSIPIEGSVYVLAKADKIGRRISFLSANLIDGESGKLASEASAVFMVP